MKLFEITIAGRRFSVTRELRDDHQSHQTYSVDGREVPVERYLELVAIAAAGGRFTSDLFSKPPAVAAP